MSRQVHFQIKPIIEADLGTSLGTPPKCDSNWKEYQSSTCINYDESDHPILAFFKGPIMSDQLIHPDPQAVAFWGLEFVRKNIEDNIQIGPAYESGCHNGGVHQNDRVEPQWALVDGQHPLNTIEGVVGRGAVLARDDLPYIHDSHDVNIDVTVGPAYQNIYSATNKIVDRETALETEWEMGVHNDGTDERFPHEFWPTPGDKVWMMGRWVFDCGHVGALRYRALRYSVCWSDYRTSPNCGNRNHETRTRSIFGFQFSFACSNQDLLLLERRGRL